MDIFDSFATDPAREVNGTWVPLNTKGARILVARSANRVHARVMNRLFKENMKELQDPNDDVATAADEKLNIEAVARSILLGWEGLTYQGKPIEYSYENAVTLLSHGDFRAIVMSHSRNMELYRAEKVVEVKND